MEIVAGNKLGDLYFTSGWIAVWEYIVGGLTKTNYPAKSSLTPACLSRPFADCVMYTEIGDGD